MVPHLVTALTGPINALEQRMLDSMSTIERWFRLEWMEHTPLFYSAVDIRNAGFKLAPVDIDLFPGGWHNLSEQMLPLAVQATMAAIEKICPEARNLLLVPQDKPDCSFYLSNIAQLQRIFKMAGLNVRVGSISAQVKKNTLVDLPGGAQVVLEPAIRRKGGGRGRLGLKDFDPCTILLNNDLPRGVPGILEDLQEQYLLPPLHAGSSVRKKGNHLRQFDDVAKRFAKLTGIDPWMISPVFETCGPINGGKKADLERLRAHVDSVLTKVRRKYKEHGVPDRPFAVIKGETGGAGCADYLFVRDAKELDLQALACQDAAELLVQEGVPTQERMNAAVAEPVVYMMDRYVVGGYYRVHADARPDENLAAPGSRFIPLAFEESTHLPQLGQRPGVSAPNRFYMYGVLARLAMLGAAYELEATDPELMEEELA
jgi:glutamate--cysteine ligase